MTRMKVTEHSEQAQHQERRANDSGLRVIQEPTIKFTKDPSSLLLPKRIKPEITIQKTQPKNHSGVNN
jgi:hypothetical protein